ncbi:dynactin 1 [Kwoniella heveanensis CBS 569]|nr:dynactin 1 [Kwoniella heveanensis CBS 569]
MTTVEAPIGAKVQVAAGIGHVRWTGSNPGFAAGKWVGVELFEPSGKNDGSVKGERFFDCQPNHGVFVRPSQVKILEAPRTVPSTPRQSVARPPPTPTTSRLSSAGPSRATSPQKPSITARPSAPSTPPRSVSQPTAVTPASSATAVAAAARRASAATPSTLTRTTSGNIFKRPPSVAAARAPTPLTPQSEESTQEQPAPSITQTLAARNVISLPPPSSTGAFAAPSRHVVSPPPASGRRIVSPTPSASGAGGLSSRPIPQRSISTTLSSAIELASSPEHPSIISTSSKPASPERDAAATFAHKRELDEMRIKVRILENRKHEDQEKIRLLESRVGEADTLRAARVKLQAKFQELQSSLVDAQRSSKDLASENTRLENRAAEAFDQLEMAALDREVAEEKAEAAEMEVAKLNEKLQELEMEVALLKEENEEYEKPVSGVEGERTSLAFVQLEKHNERLKEALIRLRDVSSEAEREHKAKMAELEKELTSQEDLISQLELAEAKLSNAEAQVEDLKLQLDDALGAEDMLEQLTERNLQMGERIEEMRVTIEDLEALKELNDELEENHVEAEKQLNEEIENLTLQLRDEQARSADLDNVILDMESTISQFRDLVADLQSEIDTLRMQQVTQESESASTSKEAQALMNLNLKLQSTAVKAQSKTVDLELKRLEAAQLAEHLRIVTAYLPDVYIETEADSTSIFLFFNRISAKVDVLINVISQLHGLPAALHSASSEALVGVCELIGKLKHFAGLNKRFASVMKRGSTDDWTAYGKLLTEINGVESKVDGWLGHIKTDDFNEGDCARDLASLIAQFDHLSEVAFNRPRLDVGEQQLALAYNFDCDLDNFAAAVGFARHAITSLAADDDIEIDVGESSLEEGVYEPVQRILDLVRSVKVPSGKLVAQIEEVVASSSALMSDMSTALGNLATSVSNAVDLAVQLAQRIGAHSATVRSTKQPLKLSDIEVFLQEITAESSAQSDAPPWELIGSFISRLGHELGSILPRIKEAVKGGQIVSMDVSPPWLARVTAIREAASFNADTERKVVKLSEELKDMLREIKIRDQNLQEAGVKVETLERRLEASRKQADIIIELENDVAKAKKQEKVYEDAIEQLQAEQDALEAENARLRKSHNAGDRGNAVTSTPGGSSVEPIVLTGASGVTLESSQLAEQVDNLRSAIRFLRHENALLKSKELYNDIHSLPTLRYRSSIDPPMSLGVPELVHPSSPSSVLSSEESDSDMPRTPTDSAKFSSKLRGFRSSDVAPTRHSIEVESKLLLESFVDFQTSNKIIDISKLGSSSSRGASGSTANAGGQWRRRRDLPETKLAEWRSKERKLEKRLEGLVERAKIVQGRR